MKNVVIIIIGHHGDMGCKIRCSKSNVRIGQLQKIHRLVHKLIPTVYQRLISHVKVDSYLTDTMLMVYHIISSTIRIKVVVMPITTNATTIGEHGIVIGWNAAQ